MGSGPSSTTTQSGQQTTSPWAPAIPYLSNILGQTGKQYLGPSSSQSSALNNLVNQAFSIPGFGAGGSNIVNQLINYGRGTVPGTGGKVGGAGTIPQQQMISNAYNTGAGDITSGVNSAESLLGSNFGNASNFLGGVYGTAGNTLGNAYNTASGALSPYLNANYTNPMAVPGFANTLNAIGQQTQQATDSLFSAAGRDPAGNAQAAKAAATATMNAEAPYLTNEYNALVGQQQGAGEFLGNLGLGAGGTLGNLGANIGGTIGSLGLGTGGTLGQLGISEGGTLGNLGINAANAITGQQAQQFGMGIEGMQAAEGLPGLYTAPGQAQLSAANAYSNAPLMNLPGLESLINPIAGLGSTSTGFGTGTTQGSTSTMGNILGGILGGSALFGGNGIFPGALSGGGAAVNPADWAGGAGIDSLGAAGGSDILGSLTSILPFFSDVRLKDDIKPIGQLSSGVPLYTFRYKGDPETRIGPMAQEVERMYPEAVVTHPSGFKMVDYNALNNGLLGGIL